MLDWLKDRLRIASIVQFLSKKNVPYHRHSFWYLFGGLTLFFFILQFITGMLLTVYYSPTPATAYESIEFLMKEVPGGWLVRSLHSWSANILVICMLIHLFSTFFMKAYRKPREILWISGIVLLLLMLGFAFTGYLLPWDTTSYFATQIGTEIPRSIPIIGNLVVTVLRGGEFIGEESLKRLFTLHVIILPFLAFALIIFHLIYNQVYGTSIPPGTKETKVNIPFYPDYIYRDIFAWTIGLLVLSILTFLFPVAIGNKADPYSSAPVGIKPAWYFLPLYETLMILPPTLIGLSSEMLINLFLAFGILIVLLLPFIERKESVNRKLSFHTAIGVVAVLYIITTIVAAQF